jgi:hypothetical protein
MFGERFLTFIGECWGRYSWRVRSLALVGLVAGGVLVGRSGLIGSDAYRVARRLIPSHVSVFDGPLRLVRVDLSFVKDVDGVDKPLENGSMVYSGDNVVAVVASEAFSWVSAFCANQTEILPLVGESLGPHWVETDEPWRRLLTANDTPGVERCFVVGAAERFDFQRTVTLALKELQDSAGARGFVALPRPLHLPPELTQSGFVLTNLGPRGL